ncbi:hypothetical protein M2475_001199 [Breznakia sp. PF5-3]|uniref:ClbS/DfsB family four-helix bundle protein n=1 Tax=unclassified Breznakia TaxID=2623764 RepID=UPI0024068FD1|nr:MULTISPECIES: ClbS/DfsB family four-helix bundle protein [unclassified Breznakia]MDF9824645.1 hypothetical protein [Breznakia sp. PM6-1]MDF9835630.1 hypothetical protein [Breznakia sp. PF5-3]MDF9837705.1 hypothetical protein [Breznakia sp. PFB2-8]MDF9859569.1 hypothetical protein [Breznakia sp. PH5-24]
MPRATNKKDLLLDAKTNYQKLMELVESFSPEEQEGTFPFEDRDRNIRDVLVHLHEWHNMMERWYREGCIESKTPVIPREGYNWKTTAAMNKMIWEMYQDVSLTNAKQLLAESHQKMIDIIESHTNEELYERGYYKWTKTTTLGQYFVGSTASHYDWAMKKIKKYRKAIK